MAKKKKVVSRIARKGSIPEAFTSLKVGDMRDYPMDEVNVSSYRAVAGMLNREAGYTRYSVAISNVKKTMTIVNNG